MKGQEFKDCFAQKNTLHWKGYADYELSDLEKLYNIRIGCQLKTFFIEMGRCDGGVYGNFHLPTNDDSKGVRSHFIFQRSTVMNVASDPDNMKFLLGGGHFVFFAEPPTVYYFLRTNKENFHVHRFDSSTGEVEDTEIELLDFLINHDVPGKGDFPVSEGDLLKI